MGRMDADEASGLETFTNDKDQIRSELRRMTRLLIDRNAVGPSGSDD